MIVLTHLSRITKHIFCKFNLASFTYLCNFEFAEPRLDNCCFTEVSCFFVFFLQTHLLMGALRKPHTHTRTHSTQSPLSEIRWNLSASPVVSLSLHWLTSQMIGWAAPPPSICRRLINPVTHTWMYTQYVQTHTQTMCGDSHLGWTSAHLHGNSQGMLWMCVCVTRHGRQSHVGLHYTTRLIHTHTVGAALDLSGDTQIWLIGLIGFQRACREKERLTLTRLLQRHQGSTARVRKSKKHEKSTAKINVSDVMRSESAGRRRWKEIYLLPGESRRSHAGRRRGDDERCEQV